MDANRNGAIDFLRGMAVILMVLVHATAYFLSDPFVHKVWDYTHIIVPLFVYCSAFAVFSQNAIKPFTFPSLFKRFKRLLLPYYLYVFGFIGVALITRSTSQLGNSVTSLILLGEGRDVGWLVVLFSYLVVLIPTIHFLYLKNKILYGVLGYVSITVAFLFLVYVPEISFRLTMWLPWTAFLWASILIVRMEKTGRMLLGAGMIALIVFIISWDLRSLTDLSFVLTENKYPPDSLYLSYGILGILTMYGVFMLLERIGLYRTHIHKVFLFLSKHSYALFFIHFLLVKFLVDLKLHALMGPWWFFAVLLGGSSLILVIFEKVMEKRAKLLPFNIKK